MRHYRIDNNDRKAYPFGLTSVDGGIHVSVAVKAKECSLLLFAPSAAHGQEETGAEETVKAAEAAKAIQRIEEAEKEQQIKEAETGEQQTQRNVKEETKTEESKTAQESIRIPFPSEGRTGDVWEMTVLGKNLDRYEYAFEADGKQFSDPYGHAFTGAENWGQTEQIYALLRSPIRREEFDWEGDEPLCIPYEKSVIYRAHVRGFTRHPSSKVKDKGTFRGITEKIPHMKELGITTLELMPVTEFSEVMAAQYAGGPSFRKEPTGKLNYWGYGPAYNGAPKASYAGKKRSPDLEMKRLVKELHRAGIELVVEMFFTGEESPVFVLDIVRRWVREYHLDGIHLVGTNVPAGLLAHDPYLAGTKLWASSWDDRDKGREGSRCLAEYNDGFQTDMRRILKGDEGQMNALAFRTRHNPADCGVINYMANTNGFTLTDMVSYEQKHNEENGEQNRDGSDHNYSWNCGAEGPVRKKKIVKLRKQQLYNALLLLLLSQGTPLLMAGDEFGNSQNGNNNAYCQDNDISWLNWNRMKNHQDLFDFVKTAIAFRKTHSVFSREREPRLMDYQVCGYPDVSYHGRKAWVPEFDYFRRQLGIMYCGAYGKKPDGTRDDDFFVAYNMHWEPHEFALPHLPKGMGWHVAFDTGDEANNGYYAPGQEPEAKDQKLIMVPPRTILVLIGKQLERK